MSTLRQQKKWRRLWSSQAIGYRPIILASTVGRMYFSPIPSIPKNDKNLRFLPSKMALTGSFDMFQKNQVVHFLRGIELGQSLFLEMNPEPIKMTSK